MKFGISLLPDCRPEQTSPVRYYEDVLEVSRLADELGFDYVKMTEHYLKDYGGYCPSPLTFLTAVAAKTRRIRLMTGGVQASFHHPVQLAAHAAMVDAISGGRLDVGFARAWLPYEFDALGIPLDESRERFTATVEAVLRLWTQKEASEDTPFFRYQDAHSLPAVTQAPHPPVWVAAVRSRQSFAWIGEKGFGLLIASPPREGELAHTQDMLRVYLETHREHHPDREPRIALSIPTMVADTDAEAFATAEPLLQSYLDVWGEAAASWDGVQSTSYPGYSNAGTTFRALTDDDLRSTSTAVIGSPDTVVRKIRELSAALTLDTLLLQIDYGSPSAEVMSRNLRLFRSEVMPRL
ncbi:LLM class flavin-dependent oxidoreductase [Streptomyces sp. NPDC058682]|uniref:LLM class flavin-dependent oxidoreductase n=1 Tax=Streptomyces TaxID=1883 RepID=UPI00365D2F3A